MNDTKLIQLQDLLKTLSEKYYNRSHKEKLTPYQDGYCNGAGFAYDFCADEIQKIIESEEE